MINIEYDQDEQAAVIRATDGILDKAWIDIRRVCEERSQIVIRQRTRSITIPWWNFLLLRSDLRYVLQKHGLSLDFEENARQLLVQAEARKAAFKLAASTALLSTDELMSRLMAMGFNRQLTPEQLRNVAELMRFPAAASFSVPGAGKTTEALAYFFLLREAGTRLIVVAPKNAFAVWEEQVRECAPAAGSNIVRLQGGASGVSEALSRDPLIALITYQQLSNVVPQVAAFMASHSCFMILDESHRMKKGQAGVYGSSVLNLAHLPVCKLILSGTPMPNAVSDLVPQFTFLYPMIRVNEENIVRHIREIFVRTTKAELGLRDPRRLQTPVEMAPAQRRLYESLRSEAARQVERLKPQDRILLRAVGRSVTRLIQVVTEPALLAGSELAGNDLLTDAIADGPSPKILEACRIARMLSGKGEKCIIWSQFVQVVETVAEMLADIGADFIHGGVEVDDDEENIESREAKIRRFHDDEYCRVLVANPAACSESISLHRVCHHAIYIDRNFNAAQYLQSEDRIHRLGLPPDQHTVITWLTTPASIDDAIQARLAGKVARMRYVLDDPNLNIEPVHFDAEVGFDIEDLGEIRRVLLGEA